MIRLVATLLALAALLPVPASAHFQTLIPSEANVSNPDAASITLEMQFTHPMAGGPAMAMAGVDRFGVFVRGEFTDLSGRLQSRTVDGKTAYSAEYTLERPGDHIFILAPKRYWEPAEGTYIVHFTKLIVDGFGGGGGWDKPVGLPVEIVPRVRPYALWTGNSFQGVVVRDGEPVPGARVEVEYLNNREPRVETPSASFETQVVYANADGEFLYTIPRAGWWGFAALVDGPSADLQAPDGSGADLEWGGLLWVHARDME